MDSARDHFLKILNFIIPVSPGDRGKDHFWRISIIIVQSHGFIGERPLLEDLYHNSPVSRVYRGKTTFGVSLS